MARSGKAMAVVAALAVTVLAGCDSTQSKNARAELKAKRELGKRELPAAARHNPDVRVERTGLVRGKAGSGAIVVRLRGTGSEPQTDVPIVVGIRGADGRSRPVNAKRHLNWFQTHVPAIPAGGTVTWVFKGVRGAKAGDRAFARVGVTPRPPLSSASSLPRIEAKVEPGGRGIKRRVSVENVSDVPQYGLQVYAYALRGGRYVTAGKTEIEHLGTGQKVTVAVPLTGSARARQLRAEALPTMFE